MAKTTIQIELDTRKALKDLKWRYRYETFDEVIRYLVAKAEPQTYMGYISEDLPDDPPLPI
jgi:hypothetical protein